MVAVAEQILTGREVEVMRLVAHDYRNKRIGRRLGISKRTVDGHVANIFKKLGVSSRAAAVHRCDEEGIDLLAPE